MLWRQGPEGIEFALVHRPRYDDWSFPKGKLDKGEHVLGAVLREVQEETGVRALLGRRLRSSQYVKDGRPKQVDYWAATVRAEPGTGRAAGTQGRFVPGDEVDRVDWLTAAEAERRLSYQDDIELLHAVADGPRETVPYIVLRHGSAGDKRDWPDDDVLRPLDPQGRSQAATLAPLLAGLRPLRLVSSATARCVETVLPYSLRADVSVVTDRAFTIRVANSTAAADRMGELVAAGVPALACTHREIVNGLIVEICTRLGGKPPDDPSVPKGGFWILHVAGGALVSLERHTIR